MNLLEKIRQLDSLFSYMAVSSSSPKEKEIISVIKAINEAIFADYETQKEHVADLFAVYERHNPRSIAYLLAFLDQLTGQLEALPVVNTDTSIVDLPDSEEVLRIFEKAYAEIQETEGNELRLSGDFQLSLNNLEKDVFISATNFVLNSQAKREMFEEEDITSSLKNLAVVRNITKSAGHVSQFYVLLRSLFDLLQRHEKFQLARDIAEDCLVCGYKDGMEDVAYSQVLRVYANTAAVPAALHYCIGSMAFMVTKHRLIDFAYKGIVLGLMRLYRNAGLLERAREVYERRSRRIIFQGYEQRSLMHAFLSTLLAERDLSLPQKIVEFLDQQREEIIGGGEIEVFPWLVTLYNIIAIYGAESTAPEECQRYMALFELIVPESRWGNLKQIILPTSLDALTALLKISLVNLAATRSEPDFVTDNGRARMISNRTIRMCFEQEDWRSYLLAMIVNSDYSLTFKNVSAPDLVEVRDRQPPFTDVYHTPDEIIAFIRDLGDCTIVWFGSDGHQVYPMLHIAAEFKFNQHGVFSIRRFRQWIDKNFASLPLEENKKGVGDMKMPKSLDDYLLEETRLAAELNFVALDTCPTQNILIVKDFEVSSFPHNLLLSKECSFVMAKNPLMNIMSMEWLLEKVRAQSLPGTSFSKGIWIPTETGDFALSYLYSFIETALLQNNFSIQQNLLPERPLHYDLNIVAAHGKPEINTFPAFYASNQEETFSIIQLNHVIGKGKILVLFVCHSGSMQSDIFRNRISTIVRSYLKGGYEAVIAPFWALDIVICKEWLPVFLQSLTAGEPVIKAVQDGNMRVREIYPTPRAYACLHAYGNPFFRIVASDSQ